MIKTLLRLLLLCVAADASAAGLPPGDTLAEQADFTATRDETRLALTSDGASGAWNVVIGEQARDPWAAQLKTPLKAEVRKDERGLVLLRGRAVATSHESGQAQFRLVVADREKPFPRIATGQYSLDAEWREIALPFVFGRDYAGGKIDVFVDLGYGRQTVELAGLRVMRFGPETELARLPRTRPTYAGHEADAVWRTEALARIERIRKGELRIEVTDADGRPVPGAEVRAELRSHAFGFGTVVNVDVLSKATPDTDRYRAKTLELFNAASFENAFKWANWEGEGKPADYRARTMRELAWLRENGIEVRGHVMVWPGWRFLPESIKALKAEPEKIRERAAAHIREIASATKGQVTEWDVLNEPVSNHDLMDLLGRGVMVDWFKEAAEALPGVPLYLNDWGNHDARVNPGTVAAFEEVVRFLREKGAPLHGLGLQCHIGGVLNAPADLLATLDRYEKNFGLPVRITEFDVNVDDEEIQADYTRDFMIAIFSHPSVVGVQQWGFWEGRHWQPKAALYRKDWTEKPNGTAYRKLVKETWHTDETGKTDERGAWSTRGFYGRYEITVTAGGKEQRVIVKHEAGGAGINAVRMVLE